MPQRHVKAPQRNVVERGGYGLVLGLVGSVWLPSRIMTPALEVWLPRLARG